jgi:hypothetical protein
MQTGLFAFFVWIAHREINRVYAEEFEPWACLRILFHRILDDEVIKPNLDVVRMVEKEKTVQETEKKKERVKKELKELQIDATEKLGKAVGGKRQRRVPAKFND